MREVTGVSKLALTESVRWVPQENVLEWVTREELEVFVVLGRVPHEISSRSMTCLSTSSSDIAW